MEAAYPGITHRAIDSAVNKMTHMLNVKANAAARRAA
jgi:hypothetical protein